MGYDSVIAKPVFFATSRRRGRIFAAAFGGSLGLLLGLAAFSGLSLLRGEMRQPDTETVQAPLMTAASWASVTPSEDDGAKPLALLIEGGPNAETTPEILDILALEKIPATFVPLGHQALQETQLVQRIYSEGHEIGQPRQPATWRADNLTQQLEVRSTLRILEALTGHSTLLQVESVPASISYLQPQPVMSETAPNGTVIVASAGAQEELMQLDVNGPLAKTISARDGFVLVLTDKAGDRLAAVLPAIINDLRARGYAFTTLSSLLGKQREDVMPKVNSVMDRFLAKANRMMLSLLSLGTRGNKLHRALEWIFAWGAFLAMVRTIVMVAFAVIQSRRDRLIRAAEVPEGSDGAMATRGRVSVLIPAYNEVLAIANVIEHALRSQYPDFEVVMIDDGSTDATYATAEKAFGNHPLVRLVRKSNGGKASALNAGLRVATGDVIVCIDGDTLMTPTTIAELLFKFRNPRVGAVAGCVKVASPRNLLTRWQEVEYAIGQNLDRQALELVNGMNTVPGAVGAFRRDVVKEVGGYESDTLAEDTDITLRILRAGYLVGYAPRAIVYTEAPETMNQLLRQRFRWSYGALQTLWKHRTAFCSRSCPGLGWFTLPQVLIFQLMLPFLVPIADAFMIAGLWSGGGWRVLAYGLIFLAVDLVAAGIALVLAGEHRRLPYLSLMLVTQRFGYRYFVFVPLVKAFMAAIHGRAVGWGHLQRMGRVAQAAS